ncbi:hypothetical protein Bca52824_062701 [Brassica carinata]|uniref:Uncharacterized protein n=1 Tax=Brassica carinata TaxID=52824 RepID=A0A8X7U9N9_BRACI|nr:hypothetical protein Bca52824_062701 [Brassica carinata]
MEEITDGVNNMNLAVDSQKKNRIQVSNTKKPLFFYVNLAKIEITLGKSEKFDELMTAANEEKEEQQKLRYRAEHSLLLISDAFVFTHPQTQVVSPPLFSSHSHTLSRCRTFSFHLSG